MQTNALNDNLEKMAKQLYDYWFVQFDFPDENGRPYKSSGGEMVWNEKLKREIPKEWTCTELNKWLEIKSGFAFKSETYISKGVYKIITIKNVQDHYLDTTSCDYVDQIPQGMKNWCVLSLNDRLISLTGNCGRLCVVTEKNLLLNQRVGLLACDDEYLDYAYLLLSSNELQAVCANLAKGAAQANLSSVDLCKNVAVLPELNILKAFNKHISPIMKNFIQNQTQITYLTKQRDELLPLLINGQASLNYHLSEWTIGFLCLDMYIEYNKSIVQKEADKQDFHPLVRKPYAFTLFKHTSNPLFVFLLQFKLFVTMSHKLPTDFHGKVRTNVVQRF